MAGDTEVEEIARSESGGNPSAFKPALPLTVTFNSPITGRAGINSASSILTTSSPPGFHVPEIASPIDCENKRKLSISVLSVTGSWLVLLSKIRVIESPSEKNESPSSGSCAINEIIFGAGVFPKSPVKAEDVDVDSSEVFAELTTAESPVPVTLTVVEPTAADPLPIRLSIVIINV